MQAVTVITHPLVQHNLTRLRDKRTEPSEFRRVVAVVTSLLVYEATRSLRLREEDVETPLETTTGGRLEQEIVLVPILRAGIGMLGSLLELIPHARVGFIGLKREESTLLANTYLQSLPPNLERFEVIVIDPMLATGGSAVAALDALVKQGAKHLRLVNLLAAPEGIRKVQAHYPHVPIFTASIDRQLNERGYIMPGLGDAGDRLFGT
jgi:uracil phosphoribosyltransferase